MSITGVRVKANFYPPTFHLDTWTQAAMVQNTWYTVLDAVANVKLYNFAVSFSGAETMELRITVDGVELSSSDVMVAGNWYNIVWNQNATMELARQNTVAGQAFPLEAKSLKIECRKTSAGVSNGSAWVSYGVY